MRGVNIGMNVERRVMKSAMLSNLTYAVESANMQGGTRIKDKFSNNELSRWDNEYVYIRCAMADKEEVLNVKVNCGN